MTRHKGNNASQINFRTSQEQVERLERIADEANMTKAFFLRTMLDEKLAEIEEKISRGEGVHVEIV